MILRHYLIADNESRLWDEFVAWTQNDDFDYELAGPRMLVHDIRRMLDKPGLDQVTHVLLQQTDSGKPGLLPNEVNFTDPDRALAWLNALLRGLLHTETSKP